MLFTTAAHAAWLLSFVVLAGLFTTISGSVYTGPWERMEKYLICRIAVLAFGAQQDKIFPALGRLTSGTHPDGGHNFLEFINWLDGNVYRGLPLEAPGVYHVTDLNRPGPLDDVWEFVSQRVPAVMNLNRMFSNAPANYAASLAQDRTVLTQGEYPRY